MYEVKNRYAILFLVAELLDKIEVTMLNNNLYLRTIKKSEIRERGLYMTNPSGELIWIPIGGRNRSPDQSKSQTS